MKKNEKDLFVCQDQLINITPLEIPLLPFHSITCNAQVCKCNSPPLGSCTRQLSTARENNRTHWLVFHEIHKHKHQVSLRWLDSHFTSLGSSSPSTPLHLLLSLETSTTSCPTHTPCCVSFPGLLWQYTTNCVGGGRALKPTESFSLTVLEAGSLESRCLQGHAPSEDSRGKSL